MGTWFESSFQGTRGQELFYQAWCVNDHSTTPTNRAAEAADRASEPANRADGQAGQIAGQIAGQTRRTAEQKSQHKRAAEQAGLNPPRGTILLTHGLSEHSETYTFFAQPMRAAMWNVVAWDLPGHGRSPGRRGYVPHFDDYSENLALFYNLVRQQFSPPVVLFGHSMGGLITLQAQLTHNLPEVAAVCLSAPALALRLQASWFKDKAARLAQKYVPRLTFANEICYEQLVHSPDVQREYKLDPLRHDRISPQVYYGMLESQKQVLDRAHTLNVPCLLQLAGLEYIVNNEAAQNFYNELGSIKKELHTYDNSLHVVFKDIEQPSVLKDFKKFLNTLLQRNSFDIQSKVEP